MGRRWRCSCEAWNCIEASSWLPENYIKTTGQKKYVVQFMSTTPINIITNILIHISSTEISHWFNHQGLLWCQSTTSTWHLDRSYTTSDWHVATFQQCLFIKIRCRKQTTVSNIELILTKHRVVNLVLFRHSIGAGPWTLNCWLLYKLNKSLAICSIQPWEYIIKPPEARVILLTTLTQH